MRIKWSVIVGWQKHHASTQPNLIHKCNRGPSHIKGGVFCLFVFVKNWAKSLTEVVWILAWNKWKWGSHKIKTVPFRAWTQARIQRTSVKCWPLCSSISSGMSLIQSFCHLDPDSRFSTTSWAFRVASACFQLAFPSEWALRAVSIPEMVVVCDATVFAIFWRKAWLRIRAGFREVVSSPVRPLLSFSSTPTYI